MVSIASKSTHVVRKFPEYENESVPASAENGFLVRHHVTDPHDWAESTSWIPPLSLENCLRRRVDPLRVISRSPE